MSVNGTWYSSVGSKLILEEKESELIGTFDSTQDPTGPQPLHGSIDMAPEATHRGLSFSLSWPAGDGYSSSVTAYTGQYRQDDQGSEEIEVIFLIADGTKSSALWKSTGISSDLFTRQDPKA